MKKYHCYTKNPETKVRYAVSAVELDNGLFGIGVARSSEKDAFIRKKGRMISEGRALSERHRLTLSFIKSTKDFLNKITDFILEFDKEYLNNGTKSKTIIKTIKK